MKLSNKFCLVIAGFLLSIIFIEIIFQIMGFAVYYHQRQGYIKENKKYEDHYRILALGESTTADLSNGESSWPAELEKILNNRSKKIKFKVFNEGYIGTTSQVILSKLSTNLDKYEPDMAITMLGYNDPKNSRVYYKEHSFNNLKIPKFLRWLRLNLASKPDETIILCKALPDNEYELAVSDAQSLIDSDNLEGAITILDQLEKNDYCFSHCDIGQLYVQTAIKISPESKKYYYGKAKRQFELGKDINNDCKVQLIYLYLITSENDSDYHNAVRLVDELLLSDHLLIDNNQGKIYGTFIEVLGGRKINTSRLPDFFYFYGYENLMFSPASQIHNATKANYNLISNILKERGIKHIAMQYPRQKVDILKTYFDSSENIGFVDNEENFETALETLKWDDIFVDVMGNGINSRIGGKPFGHATLLGNRLIAENAADVILKELNITS